MGGGGKERGESEEARGEGSGRWGERRKEEERLRAAGGVLFFFLHSERGIFLTPGWRVIKGERMLSHLSPPGEAPRAVMRTAHLCATCLAW